MDRSSQAFRLAVSYGCNGRAVLTAARTFCRTLYCSGPHLKQVIPVCPKTCLSKHFASSVICSASCQIHLFSAWLSGSFLLQTDLTAFCLVASERAGWVTSSFTGAIGGNLARALRACCFCLNGNSLIRKTRPQYVPQCFHRYVKDKGFIKMDLVNFLEWVMQETYLNANLLYIN